MFSVNIKRITKGGFVNFWRNGWVSFATVLVMVLTLFVIGGLILSNVVLTSVIASLEDKVDITVYFRTSAAEPDILAVKDSLTKLGEVESVEYVSRAEALERFKERHKENALITQSLDEVGDNPLGAALNIQAKDPSQYASITTFLEGNILSGILDKVNYRQNQLVIDRLSSVLRASRKVGISISIVLAVIAFLVAFNTIRMAIYTSREEIRVMKLVGASNWYTRGPFLVEGFLHGFLASVIATLTFWPLTFWLGGRIQNFFGGPNLLSYYQGNFFEFFLVLFLAGTTLGVVSSSIAIRRYMRV
jgi:cell division transport system permease protein